MEKYKQERSRQDKIGKMAGAVLSIGAHVVLLGFGAFSGLKYIYPPPQEQTFVIDFEEEEETKPVQAVNGREPQAEEVDLTKPVDLVKKSEAQEKGTKANKAPEATMGDHGDVAKYEPPREKPINNKALFHAADNKAKKDTLAAQTAAKVSEALSSGHASGNTNQGKLDGSPNAHVKGRTIDKASLVKPGYNSQESGTVVVDIWVDQYGNVTKAIAGATGTTVTDSKLWAAARAAALKAHFNMDADAPALQQGTITYNFILK